MWNHVARFKTRRWLLALGIGLTIALSFASAFAGGEKAWEAGCALHEKGDYAGALARWRVAADLARIIHDPGSIGQRSTQLGR